MFVIFCLKCWLSVFDESSSIGSETVVKALPQAAKNKSVKAVVLRVNSPGGDAIASELITNEVIKTKKIKPVIVSMGDVAASAGYEMSSNATKIVALPDEYRFHCLSL